MNESVFGELSRHARIVCADVGNMPTIYHETASENKTSINSSNNSSNESLSKITTAVALATSVAPSKDSSKTTRAEDIDVEGRSRESTAAVTATNSSSQPYRGPTLSSEHVSTISSDDHSSAGFLPPVSKDGTSNMMTGQPYNSADHGTQSSSDFTRPASTTYNKKDTGVGKSSDLLTSDKSDPRLFRSRCVSQSSLGGDGFSSPVQDGNPEVSGKTRDWSFARRSQFAGTEATNDWKSAREQRSCEWGSIREPKTRDKSLTRGATTHSVHSNDEIFARGRQPTRGSTTCGRHSPSRVTNRKWHSTRRINAGRDDVRSDASSDTKSTAGSDCTDATWTTSSTPSSRGRSSRGRNVQYGRGRGRGGPHHVLRKPVIRHSGFVDLDAPGVERAIIERHNEELCQYMEKLKRIDLSNR